MADCSPRMSAMFANSRPATGNSGSSNIIEFKAGRSSMQSGSGPTKRKVIAEKTKGTVYIKQSNDQLMHFCWKNRETGATVDDLIIFPGDTEFKEVKGCPDGQVFMLKFKTSQEIRLFWVQEPVLDKDLCQKVNDALNKPPQARLGARGGSAERSTAAASLASLGGSDELNALSNLDQNQLMQILQLVNQSGGGPGEGLLPSASSGSAAAEPSTPVSSAPDLSQIQQILRGIPPGAPRRQRPNATTASVDLADVITGERTVESARSNSDRLIPHLPSSSEPEKELIETVHSPQFRQASSVFGHALQSGQMGPVLEQFGISNEATQAAANGDLLEFAKKLTESEKKPSGSGTSSETPQEQAESPDAIKEPEPKRGKTEDEDMELD